MLFIKETQMDDKTSPVFKRAELSVLYKSEIEQLWIKHDDKVRMIRLKQRLLAHFPNTCAQHQWRDVLFAFNENLGDAMAKAFELDRELDVVPPGATS